MPLLEENYYGKSRIRVMKVVREGQTHQVFEWNVGIYLTGDFTACFVAGDNTGLVATDTMKNTVYSVARTSSARTMEQFALEVAQFLAERNPQVSTVRVTVEEKMWIRLKAASADGTLEKHGSAFMQRGPEVTTTSVTVGGGAAQVTSGVKGLVILKTSHSAFAGFKRDELTTLPETHDRLLGTEATIVWQYGSHPADFAATRRSIMSTLLTTFANHDSLSVQQTLYAMAGAVLATEPQVDELTLTMPNRHNLSVDFGRFAPPFNQPNDNTIFVPQDEPHGQIHARVVR